MKITFTPEWFLAPDVLIEIFSFFILLAFFILCIKNYKLSKNKNLKYLGTGFLLIAIAELATILTKSVLFYDLLLASFTQRVGQIILTTQVVKSVDIFYYAGFFFYKLLTLLGLFIIYRLPLKKKLSEDVLLIAYFLVISALVSSVFSYLFHLTVLLLIILIMYAYYTVYKKNKSENTKVLIMAFGILAIAHIIFMISCTGAAYALGQVIQLVSYIILLFLIIRILKYGKKDGKKEKQNKYNI